MSISEKIRKARKDAGLKQKELAAKIGLTGKAISTYEGGSRSVSLEHLQAIASATQKPVSWFFDEKDRRLSFSQIANQVGGEVDELKKRFFKERRHRIYFQLVYIRLLSRFGIKACYPVLKEVHDVLDKLPEDFPEWEERYQVYDLEGEHLVMDGDGNETVPPGVFSESVKAAMFKEFGLDDQESPTPAEPEGKTDTKGLAQRVKREKQSYTEKALGKTKAATLEDDGGR